MSLSPEPLALDGLLTDDERRPAPFPDTARAECLKIIARLEGPEGVAAFLRTPQDDLDSTGGELLQSDPAALLARLKRLEMEKSLAVIDDELDEHITIDPFNGDPPSKRKDRETSRLLAILDNLGRGDA